MVCLKIDSILFAIFSVEAVSMCMEILEEDCILPIFLDGFFAIGGMTIPWSTPFQAMWRWILRTGLPLSLYAVPIDGNQK